MDRRNRSKRITSRFFIVKHLDDLKLELYSEENNGDIITGHQYKTKIGVIDLLCK